MLAQLLSSATFLFERNANSMPLVAHEGCGRSLSGRPSKSMVFHMSDPSTISMQMMTESSSAPMQIHHQDSLGYGACAWLAVIT